MAVLQIGSIIKKKREELMMTQEDLARGICSVPSLSRIENGDRMPSRERLGMILQRLGYSETTLDWIVDEDDFDFYELKVKLRQAHMQDEIEEARELLEELKTMRSDLPVNKQFILLYTVLLNKKDYSTKERLELLEEALRYTAPRYTSENLPAIMFYEEILVLNNIAIAYQELGDADTAIRMLYHIDKFYSSNVIHQEEAWRTQPMILYNLSKFLGMAGRNDECIVICERGISLARRTGRCKCLAQTLYNLSCALVFRKRRGDRETAQQMAEEAYQMATIMGKIKSQELYRKYLLEEFNYEV